MTKNNAYSNILKKIDFTSEIERLKIQANIFWEKEKDYFIYSGIKEGMSILEIGSGPGYVTEQIKKSFPNNPIVCVEPSQRLLEIAKNSDVLKKFKDISFIENSFMDSNLNSDSFDFIYARFVLQHIPETEKIIRETYRLLKKNGIIIITEDNPDTILLRPKIKNTQILEKINSEFNKMGADREKAFKIPKILKKANFLDVKITMPISHSDIEPLIKAKELFSPAVLKPFYDSAVITQEELRYYEEIYSNINMEKEPLILYGIIVITGKK